MTTIPDPYVPHNDQVAFDSATRTFQIYSEDLTEIGTHAVELSAVLTAQPLITAATPLSWTIDILPACTVTNTLTSAGSSYGMSTYEKNASGVYVQVSYATAF